jgi:hypothetical protein
MLQEVAWRRIDAQVDLDELDASVGWDHADVVAMVVDSRPDQASFPDDVSRSGFLKWNVRVLLSVDDRRGSHLELGLLDCDRIPGDFNANGFSLSGRVDSLKRVTVYSSSEQLRLRCSRLLYRFVEVDQQVARSWYGTFDTQAG